MATSLAPTSSDASSPERPILLAELADLPAEVISHILSFLRLKDLKIVRLTCKWLYDLAVDRKLQDTEVLTLRKEKQHEFAHFFQRTQRIFINVQANDAFSENPVVWPTLKDRLVWLRIYKCCFAENAIHKILTLCPEVTSLHIFNCIVTSSPASKLQDVPYFTNLNTLIIDKFVGAGIFGRLVDNSPNLTSVSIIDYEGTTPEGVAKLRVRKLYEVLFAMENIKVLKLAPARVSRQDLERIAELNNLEVLVIHLSPRSLGQFDSEVFTGLCNGPVNTTLKRLELPLFHDHELFSMTPVNLVRLAQSYPALKYLDLSGWHSGINICSVESIFRHLVSLETLIMTNCGRNLYRDGIPHFIGGLIPRFAPGAPEQPPYDSGYSIDRLTKLRRLDIMDNWILGDLGPLTLPSLRQVTLGIHPVFTDLTCTAAVDMLRRIPTIQKLLLPFGFEMSSELVQTIIETRDMRFELVFVLPITKLKLTMNELECLGQLSGKCKLKYRRLRMKENNLLGLCLSAFQRNYSIRPTQNNQ